MREMCYLADFPFTLNEPDVLAKLRIAGRAEYAERCTRLIRQALDVGRPRAAYGLAYVDEKADDSVVLDGVRFASRVLRVNLGEVNRVFPFLITCGRELDDWSRSFTDMLERFWADAIMEESLLAALDALKAHLAGRYQVGKTAMMNPGSLTDWPLEQQRPLFDILGEAGERSGVRLTDSFLMAPVKSVSGILFQTETAFENCQLCPRETCPNRRAPYDPSLYDKQYARSEE